MALQSETIQVSGVRCEKCIGRVAGALKPLEGIEYANANLMGQIDLQWDDAKLSREALVESLRKAGFPELA
jgi:copper chaperone CopZ